MSIFKINQGIYKCQPFCSITADDAQHRVKLLFDIIHLLFCIDKYKGVIQENSVLNNSDWQLFKRQILWKI